MEHFATSGEPDWDGLHEDVEVYDHDIMDAGDYQGHAGFARWMEDWASAWSEYTMEPQEFLDADDRVVVFLRQITTGQGSGVALEREDAMVVQLRDAKIICLDYYNSREQALKAVGLER